MAWLHQRGCCGRQGGAGVGESSSSSHSTKTKAQVKRRRRADVELLLGGSQQRKSDHPATPARCADKLPDCD